MGRNSGAAALESPRFRRLSSAIRSTNPSGGHESPPRQRETHSITFLVGRGRSSNSPAGCKNVPDHQLCSGGLTSRQLDNCKRRPRQYEPPRHDRRAALHNYTRAAHAHNIDREPHAESVHALRRRNHQTASGNERVVSEQSLAACRRVTRQAERRSEEHAAAFDPQREGSAVEDAGEEVSHVAAVIE